MPPYYRYRVSARDFAVKELDAAVLKRIWDNWEEETGSEGMRVFLDKWTEGTDIDAAKQLILDFNLQDELGEPDTLEERYEHVDEIFYDIERALNDGPVRTINERSELARKQGPAYSAGRDGLDYGLIFEASVDDLEELRKKYPKQTEARTAQPIDYQQMCAHNAIELIQRVDFGHDRDSAIVILEQADTLLTNCGMPNADLKMAIRHFLTDRAKAKDYLYGKENGATDGALNQLKKVVGPLLTIGAQMSSSPRFITFRGAIYEKVEEKRRPRIAYHLPKDIKGVTLCKKKDVKDPKKDIWCAYDHKGKLRARKKNKKDAIRYKVMMIRRFLGSGKAKSQGKYRPPKD